MIDAKEIQNLLAQCQLPPEDTLPDGCSDADLNGFEERTRISMPHDLRAWLKLSNGPCVGPGGLFGVRPNRTGLGIESRLDIFPSWKVRKWIPIAGDGCGNYYIVPTLNDYGKGFPVVFLDTMDSRDSAAYIVSSDIGHFLVSLLEQELGASDWPFNEKVVVERDPRILKFKGVRLPWSRQYH
jgi:cell wall assembly regulator SMI1